MSLFVFGYFTMLIAGSSILLGHAKIESTVQYLGVEVEDALTLSEQIEL